MAHESVEIVAIAKNYIQQLIKSGVDIKKAFLYGSYATGKYHSMSDIDVAIVVPGYSKDFAKNIRLVAKISRLVDGRIETKGFEPESFIDEHPLAWEIKQHGILLH